MSCALKSAARWRRADFIQLSNSQLASSTQIAIDGWVSCPGRDAACKWCGADPGPTHELSMGPGSASHHATVATRCAASGERSHREEIMRRSDPQGLF